jgi:hypothetical protein
MTTGWRSDVAAVRTLLALGAVSVRHHRGIADRLAERARLHTLPDLTGASVDEIVSALVDVIALAHPAGSVPDDADDADARCSACMEAIERASRVADPTRQLWPEPVKRRLAQVIDQVLAAETATAL